MVVVCVITSKVEGLIVSDRLYKYIAILAEGESIAGFVPCDIETLITFTLQKSRRSVREI